MLHIIWDLDGTLIDSAEDVEHCLEIAVKRVGLKVSDQINPFMIGPTIDVILKEAFNPKALTVSIIEAVINAYREIYDSSDFENTRPFPGVEEILSDSAHFTNYIVTNKPDIPTKRILSKLNWLQYIKSIHTPYTNCLYGRKQSKIEIFSEIVNKSNISILSFMGIGDSETDCIAAKENDITSIGVLWGYGKDKLCEYSDYTFENAYQLHNFLLERTKNETYCNNRSDQYARRNVDEMCYGKRHRGSLHS